MHCGSLGQTFNYSSATCSMDHSQLTLSSMSFFYPRTTLNRIRSVSDLEDIHRILRDGTCLLRFSCSRPILTQFEFASTSLSSNFVPIPGGRLRLMKRRMDTFDNWVLGIELETSDLWLVRVASVTGNNRVDLMAGNTKSHPLRVPNAARGTWTDLLPCSVDFAQNIFPPTFIIEYM